VRARRCGARRRRHRDRDRPPARAGACCRRAARAHGRGIAVPRKTNTDVAMEAEQARCHRSGSTDRAQVRARRRRTAGDDRRRCTGRETASGRREADCRPR
jgi:hypothetical protein